MGKPEQIAVSRLVLHEENPRFRTPMAQDEAIGYFSKDSKTRKLAKDISQRGLNPLKLIGVNRVSESSNKLLVREGNRRAAALKLLLDPSKAADPRSEAYFAKLAREAQVPIPHKAWVSIVPKEEDLRHWIRLEHVPTSDGVSTLHWDTWETENFDGGMSGKHRYARELVNAGMAHGWLPKDTPDRAIISTLNRVLEDVKGREILGFQVDSNGLHTVLAVSDQEKLISRLVKDTGKGGAHNSRTLLKTAQIEAYAKGLVKELGLKVDTSGRLTRFGSAPPSKPDASEGGKGSRKKAIPNDKNRKHVVPRGYSAPITNARADEVLQELKLLDVHKTPNACAVLLRMLIEFSFFHYAELNGIETRAKDGQKRKLHFVIIDGVKHLLEKGRVKKGEVALINKSLTQDDHFLSVAQLNQFVHNPDVHAKPTEINSDWNGVAAVIKALWA